MAFRLPLPPTDAEVYAHFRVIMRYLITGGAGFIGSHLVERLVGSGDQVVVLDDFSTGKRAALEPWLDRIELIEGSITDPHSCARAVRGCQFVLHQAAMPSVARSVADPLRSHAVNATGTLAVLIAARDAGIQRVIYASSSSVYGNTPELPKREAMVPHPRSPYAVAKLCGEQYCGAFTAAFGLETVALRYFNVYGPRQDPASQYAAAIPRFISAALAGTAPQINGDGGQTRDFTHVGNVVEANLLACRVPGIAGSVFNIGGGRRISINDLWAEIRRQTGSDVVAEYTATRPGDVRDSLASLDRSRQALGYQPLIPFERGLEETIRSFRTQLRESGAR